MIASVKVSLDSFARVDSLSLGGDLGGLLYALIDPAAGYAYYPLDHWVGKIAKVSLNYGSGNWSHAAPLVVNGDMSIGNGSLTSNSKDITLGGNWSNGGTYIPGRNTVSLVGDSQTVTGSNTFFNLVKNVGAALSLESGKLLKINGKLTMRGQPGAPLSVNSTIAGSAFKFESNEYQFMRYATVQDVDASSGRTVYAYGCADAGNNLNVVFSAPAQIAISTPAASATNPAWVEGANGPDCAGISVSVNNAAPFAAKIISAKNWFADNASAGGAALGVSVSPTELTHVEISATDGETTNIAAQDISWTATDLAGKFFSSDTIRIRKGDSLLLTATGTGTTLNMDANGDGVYEFSGMPGDKFPALFDTPGTYAAKAKMDGVEIGSLMIHVLDADIHKPIACEVGFQREKNVVISPITQRTSVIFTTNDSYLMDESEKGAFSNTDGQGTTIYLKAKKRGTPILLARLPGVNGAMVAYKEIDEFTLDKSATTSALFDADTRIGGSSIILRPYISNIRFQFDMFAHTATFSGGLTHLSVNTSDRDLATDETFFSQTFDPETGEVIGVYSLDLEMPDGEASYCFAVEPRQSASSEVAIGNKGPINGNGCFVTVDPLFLVVGDATPQDLVVTVVDPAKETNRHVITILNSQGNIDPKQAYFSNGKGKTKTDSAVEVITSRKGQYKEKVLPGGAVKSYNVKIAETVFKDRINVINKDGITIVPATAALRVGETQLFSAYSRLNGKVVKVKVDWKLDTDNYVKKIDFVTPVASARDVAINAIAGGAPTKLTATNPLNPAETASASIIVYEFTLSPKELIMSPKEALPIILKLDSVSTATITAKKVVGGGDVPAVEILDEQGVVLEKIKGSNTPRTLMMRFKQGITGHPLNGTSYTVVFTPESPNPCSPITLTVKYINGLFIRPQSVEECLTATGNSHEFEAFNSNEATKLSDAVAVKWTVDNAKFTVVPAVGGKKAVISTKEPGATKVTATLGDGTTATATYTVYSIQFTQKPADVCIGMSAKFVAESIPKGKNVLYSIDGFANGCAISRDGTFRPGISIAQIGPVTVAASLDGLSECRITTKINVHSFNVAVAPSVIPNKVGSSATASAYLDGNTASVAWSITPDDKKVAIASDGKVSVVSAPAADSYTIKGTDTATGFSGTTEISLVDPVFSEATHCSGFYPNEAGGDPTLIVCAGGSKFVRLSSTGSGVLFLTSASEKVAFVADPKDRIMLSPGDQIVNIVAQLLAPAQASADTTIDVRVGAIDGPVCTKLKIKVLPLVTFKVQGRLAYDDADGNDKISAGDNHADKAKINFQAMIDEATSVWESQACIRFVREGDIEDCQVTKEKAEQQKLISRNFGNTWNSKEIAAAINSCTTLKNDRLNVTFVPNFDAADLPDTIGYGIFQDVRSAIPENGATESLTMAHEFGHNFGIDHPEGDTEHKKGDLMDSTGSGCRLTLDDVIRANAKARELRNRP
jgi:hypothetical protein